MSKIGEGRGKNQRWGRSVERGLSPGSGKLVLTRLCRLLNAVHALVSSANVVTAIYQVTGQDLHGFKSPFEHVSGCALFTDTDRPITPSPPSQSSTSTFPTVFLSSIFVFLAQRRAQLTREREMNLFIFLFFSFFFSRKNKSEKVSVS